MGQEEEHGEEESGKEGGVRKVIISAMLLVSAAFSQDTNAKAQLAGRLKSRAARYAISLIALLLAAALTLFIVH